MIKSFLKTKPFLYNFLKKIICNIQRKRNNRFTHIYSKSPLLRIKKDCIGLDNVCIIEEATVGQLRFHIRGNNNRIKIGSNCSFGANCSLWIEGNNSEIIIGDNTTMTHTCHINCQEDNMKIVIGRDCMFSNNIIIRTSDSHPIYDTNTDERINPPKNVILGNHIWIAPNSKIMKGAIIGDNSIIGSDTTVGKEIGENVLVVGRPGRVVKTNVRWTREKLF